MYGSVRLYNLVHGSTERVVSRVQPEFVPLIRQAEGFISYALAVMPNDRLMTYSVFESKAGAEESVKLARSWVQENIATSVRNPPEVLAGSVRIRLVTKTPKYVVMRRYWTDPKNVEEIINRTQTGFLPIVSGLPGFATYSALDVGDGNLVTLSGFDNAARADESVRAAAAWVKSSLGPLLPNGPIVTSGDVRFLVLANST